MMSFILIYIKTGSHNQSFSILFKTHAILIRVKYNLDIFHGGILFSVHILAPCFVSSTKCKLILHNSLTIKKPTFEQSMPCYLNCWVVYYRLQSYISSRCRSIFLFIPRPTNTTSLLWFYYVKSVIIINLSGSLYAPML